MSVTRADVENMTLGELAARIPLASKLFQKHHLDFCCRGNQRLLDACRLKGVPEEELIDELDHLIRGKDEILWDGVSNAVLTRHIIDEYHESLRATVPEILRLARKVEAVHRDHADCPAGLSGLLSAMWEELEQHMQKEEQILFPMISVAGGQVDAAGPVRQMMHEHVEHGEGLARIRSLCGGFKCPKGACSSWQALYLSLAALEEELMEHIHLENNVLFQRAVAGNTIPV